MRPMFSRRIFSFSILSLGASGLAGCFAPRPFAEGGASAPGRELTRTLSRPNYAATYGPYPGERFAVPAVNYQNIDPRFLRQTVDYPWEEPVGSVVVDPGAYHLYFVEAPGRATRYGVGVGREGFGWSGPARINMKRDWPDWVPPREMIARDPEIRARLEPTSRGLGVRGGPLSPLGARAMYLFGEGRDLGYRIHGTLEPETVGSNVSSGCIRMVNQDIVHLYTRAAIGTPVTVLST
ncbi:L,D-transpeptidase [Methylocystis sp. JR02]|uniref:L,D-transpeptidase n=1 Tax=Methylocystis sp. JR02 TaxID=3046284 RepID=UPI0024B8BFA1|nr:L,D-transpeptidase [Methylocystis sp. JR02]MDJ0449324.1 L,D-transpeptidase [Methylocystis sp. JR02]